MTVTKSGSLVASRNGRGDGFVGWPVSVLLAMAASSTNGVIDLLEKLLKVLKEEHVFDRSDDQPVVRFRYPAYLQRPFPIPEGETIG
ncbi:uncharacterized protein LOC113002876 isoform X4 [Solenopsis invicta]|uniref:uncharacterized protein LOC113002876 isoform X4 n=1 Tax=Solenopsis invicta TaxID=13686 RepID=UPI00193D311F|nr:uncharacterized protein LOC113002876 isoform X4 [Solenopsis invicta]